MDIIRNECFYSFALKCSKLEILTYLLFIYLYWQKLQIEWFSHFFLYDYYHLNRTLWVTEQFGLKVFNHNNFYCKLNEIEQKPSNNICSHIFFSSTEVSVVVQTRKPNSWETNIKTFTVSNAIYCLAFANGL